MHDQPLKCSKLKHFSYSFGVFKMIACVKT